MLTGHEVSVMDNKPEASEKLAVPKKAKTNATNLLSLNDHCLLCVFGFMNIRDVVNAEQTYTRLRDIAKLYYRTTKTLDWTPDLPFAAASKIICKFGCFSTSLHSLRFDQVEKPLVSDVNKTKAYQHFIDTLLDNCKDIKSLTFYGCDVSGEWAPFFDALQHLESLSLFHTFLHKSNYLRRVNTLKQFTLVGYNNFTTQKFTQFMYNNRRLTRLVLKDCDGVSKELFYELGEQKLECLTIDVFQEDVKNAEQGCQIFDGDGEKVVFYQHLKKLKITQAMPDLNLNIYLKKITENAQLDELELFKVNVDQGILAVLSAIKLTTLKLFPRIQKGNVSLFCHMLVDTMSNLKHLSLILFDLDFDADISDADLLMLIERLPHLESLNLYHCECECDCDYVVCPFRCKLRALIGNINKIFEAEPQRPNLKLILPKHGMDEDFSKFIFDEFMDTLSAKSDQSEEDSGSDIDMVSDDDSESSDSW